jgi:ATP-dependent helicase HrpA
MEDARGGHGDTHKLSNRQYEQLLRQNFINIRRVREWRDIHSQLLTVVTEHKWRINAEPAGYEPLHLSMLAGLLGNVGWKLEDDEAYLGARGIKFYKHPGAHLKKKPGRWIVAAELVETTRLFGRGIANIEPQWLEQVAGHLLKKQLLDPHWEKKGAQVSALERATLYGLVVYSGRRVAFTKVDPVAAREIFIREALVAGQWESKFPFLAANRKLVREVEGLEHKSRRQDVLVDEELIFAFYDAQLPADVAAASPSRTGIAMPAEGAAAPAEPHARRADAPPGRRHHHAIVPEDTCGWAASIARPPTCTSPAMRRTA